jgi:cysteinyl-tRNA synthetase
LKTTVANLEYRLTETVNLGENEEEWLAKINTEKVNFIKEMDDDFNSANAIATLFDLAKLANVYLREGHSSKRVLEEFLTQFEELSQVLGFVLTAPKELLDSEIDKLIEQRNEARKNKDFTLADKIRDDLKEMKIVLEDTSQGVRWKRV